MTFPHRHPTNRGFTLVELLAVITIIAILTGLILGTAGFIQKQAAAKRAEAEIAAFSAALESYRADNGIYPDSGKGATNPGANGTPGKVGSLELYKALSGLNEETGVPIPNQKTYFEFKPNMLEQTGTKVTAILDPFGTPYGYYTPDPSNPSSIVRNPTFDLWSIRMQPTNQKAWISNW